MVFKHLILFATVLMVWFFPHNPHAEESRVFSNYEYYVTEDGTFGLYKPKGWKVDTKRYPNGRMVFVTDPKDMCFASTTFLDNIDPKHDAVTFAGTTMKNINAQMPDLSILEARSSRDRMHTVVKYERGSQQSNRIQGKYTFTVKHPTSVVFGYEAPAKQFREMVPALLTIIANITVLDDQAYQRIASQKKGQGQAILPMKSVSAADGTCSLMVPDGWTFTAGNGRALCTSPDGDTGFIFTVIDFVGQSQIPYFNSSSLPGSLRYNYMPPNQALIAAGNNFGSSNHKIIERYSNPFAAQASSSLNRTVDAEIVLMSYTSKNGVPCTGYYDVLGLHPDSAGQWGIIPMGMWAPTSHFARSLPSLIKIAESYRMNQQWASEYVSQGMANVRAMMQKTSSMMSRYAEEMRQSSLAGHENRMKSSDFISYKFSTYVRGEQEWVTGLEGGQIYTTDHWGLSSGGKTIIEGPPFNYYNYQGDTWYGHIPVDSSREVYEAVKGIQ